MGDDKVNGEAKAFAAKKVNANRQPSTIELENRFEYWKKTGRDFEGLLDFGA